MTSGMEAESIYNADGQLYQQLTSVPDLAQLRFKNTPSIFFNIKNKLSFLNQSQLPPFTTDPVKTQFYQFDTLEDLIDEICLTDYEKWINTNYAIDHNSTIQEKRRHEFLCFINADTYENAQNCVENTTYENTPDNLFHEIYTDKVDSKFFNALVKTTIKV